ncbi:L-threonine 3-dehydrogenase [Roseovarius sp. THAF9]|uniref:zinc-dependent alcohol dehydrogenase n=1 Tax=Roseovarius sp. THAF9 TaxID=2587847 RepID=UPI0012A89E09|nr:zinc-binding alcohol dehydrogenase [Roseovarius sp. THAF9]QFT93638.1 L-threonine 3-dehydrogenase [Roseovarius sp. THAF9]
MAQALWITGPGAVEMRETAIDAGPGMVEVETLYSGISRGTERLVWSGGVPESEHQTMKAPFQEGEFSFPVKYGYAAVGHVSEGAGKGQVVFALHPHQDRFAVREEAAVPVPTAVPPERAILAANMETALNIVWDAEVSAGDRVTVVGAGVVGALAGYLCARMPGTEVCLVDVDEQKAALAEGLGCAFAAPGQAAGECDVAIHASASSDGLATAIGLAGMEATIVEASWFGTHRPEVPLGGAFHQRRLRIVGSQVGQVPPARRARWSYRRRLEKALDLLADPALDVLISGETPFEGLAAEYGAILEDAETLCHRVRYGPVRA